MMPRTMTPRGTASQCGRISVGIDLEAWLSEEFLKSVETLGRDERERGHWRGRGHWHEYMREDASLPRRWRERNPLPSLMIMHPRAC